MERLRGVNLGGWFSQVNCIQEKDPAGFPGLQTHIKTFITPEDIQRIADWGFNHIRLPVDYFNVFDPKTLKPDEKIFALLDAAIDWVKPTGMKLMFDLHKCPGHDFLDASIRDQAFFADASMRADALKVWTVLAERYGSQEHVMLEILNEPVAPNNQIWDAVKNEFHAHIRKYAPKSCIVIGSNFWNSVFAFKDLTPVDDANVLYSFHYYNPVIFTHQWVPWHEEEPAFKFTRTWPGNYEYVEGSHKRLKEDFGLWNRDRMEQALEPVIRFRETHKLPVACGEFGAWAGVHRESQLNWTRDFLFLMKKHDLGYSYWNYKNLDFGMISVGEQLHSNKPQYQNPLGLDLELTELLCQD
jgi:aryl-phospho-beta-D-glucosidase BglC (GH1 family)